MLRWDTFGTLALVACTLAVTGCGEPAPESAGTDPSSTDPAITMSATDRNDVTASYRCDEGHRIDIIRGNVARLALSDGRVVKLEVVEDSRPRTFTDHGLTFVEQADASTLDDDNDQVVDCRPIRP